MQFVRSELQIDQEMHDTKDQVSSLVAKATPARVGSSPNGGSGKENIGKRENKINLTSPCPQFHRHISCRPMLTKQDPWALGAREFMVSFGRRPQLGSARRPFYCRRPGFPFLPPHLDPRCCILAQSEPSCTVTTSRPFFFLV